MTARRPSLSAAIASPETITAFAHNFGPVQPSPNPSRPTTPTPALSLDTRVTSAPGPRSAPSSPSRAPNPPSSTTSTSTTATLRSRRASISKSTPPASSGTSTTPSSPATRSSKEVGLGLMLDEDANGAHPQPPSIGAASARAREMMTRLGLDEDIEQAPVAPGSAGASASGRASRSASRDRAVDGAAEWASFDRPGSNQSRNSAVSVPRLSTTGGSSPLLVYTGTPLLSASSSPYVPQTSHPSHRAPSPSLYASGMERSSSLQSQRSSGDHSRHQSLTSACPPVTSSVSPSPNPEYPSSPSQREREKGGWKASAYDWGSSNTPSSKDDPRNGGKSHHLAAHATNPLWTIVNLPSALLAFFLSPLSSSHHSSPALSNSTSPSVSKRWPFPLRLLTISYLIFSCLFFGIKITSSGKELRPNPNMKISPRGVEGDMLEMGVGRGDLANEDAKNFVLGRMGGNVGGWAQKVADGVRWGVQGAGQQAKAVRSKPEEWGLVKRVTPGQVVLKPDENPLTSLTHTYRFAKMHDKIHWDLPDEIEPFAFRATSSPSSKDVTACYYSNEAWLSTVPAFVDAWNGPVSLVFEAAHSRTSSQRSALLDAISTLRENNPKVRQFVDFHIVGTPLSKGERSLNKTRERLVTQPLAFNFHLNLARFFAPTDVIYVVGDARVVPSRGLRSKLKSQEVRDLVVGKGDAVVVPTFGFVRDPTGDGTVKAPTVHTLRAGLGFEAASKPWDGITEDEMMVLGKEHVAELYRSLPLQPDQWPQKKANLVPLVRTRVGTPEHPSEATLALFDRRWDLNHGPTNWYLWRKTATDPRLLEAPELGGGVGLGVGGAVGGGKDVFRVTDYDLHFAPNVVVSKKGQPWCTERFDSMHAACVYQMYLSGAEMWVLPDEWAFTIESIDKNPEVVKEDPAEKLKKSISSRLYGKFHQEACMHYGREFLSVAMWDSDKAQHLRSVCARTLGTWGMGESSS